MEKQRLSSHYLARQLLAKPARAKPTKPQLISNQSQEGRSLDAARCDELTFSAIQQSAGKPESGNAEPLDYSASVSR